MARPGNDKKTPIYRGIASYVGEYRRGVDNGRIILPIEWRSRAPADFAVILWPVTTPEYLLVLPPSRWETLLKNLEGLSLTDEQAAAAERLIGSRTSMRSLDHYGRLPLPEEAAKELGIESEAVLVGRLSKFEVWNPSRLAATRTDAKARAVENAITSLKI